MKVELRIARKWVSYGDGVLARVVRSRRDLVYENLAFRPRFVDIVSLLGNEREN